MREGEEGLLIPLVGGVTEHESLVSCSNVVIILLNMNRRSNLLALFLELQDHSAVVAIQTDIGAGISYLLGDSSSDSFEVNVLFA